MSFRTFTPANTGLEKATCFPELGSVFKAAVVKSGLWFFAKIAMEIASEHPDETRFGTSVFFLENR